MHPIPEQVGVGVTSLTPLDLKGFRYESVGIYHNYHVTPTVWEWPEKAKPSEITLDGFSPNLNKDLHVGHIKNLAIAAALANITKAKPVAMLGVTIGEKEGAYTAFNNWCHISGYQPFILFDRDMKPPTGYTLTPGTGEYEGCKMFNGVVIYRSEGRPTYAAHDLSFVEFCAPDLYLTGYEQHEHFKSLGLGDQHKPMGLVLGKDYKKMRSREKEGAEANLVAAEELFEEVSKVIKPSENAVVSPQLAWNVLAWQFNSAAVGKNTILDIENWCNVTSPGIYISYTYARIRKALGPRLFGIEGGKNLIPFVKFTLEDAQLAGYASQYQFYWQKAIKENEPVHIAQFTLRLAKKLSEIYGRVHIREAEKGFLFALQYALNILGFCMNLLSMKVMDEI